MKILQSVRKNNVIFFLLFVMGFNRGIVSCLMTRLRIAEDLTAL